MFLKKTCWLTILLCRVSIILADKDRLYLVATVLKMREMLSQLRFIVDSSFSPLSNAFFTDHIAI
jgi:hypothetical protein